MSRQEDNRGFTVIGHSDLGGYGDGMQVLREGDALYVGHFGPSGMGTSVLDVSDPTRPEVVVQWPAPTGSHTHKVQVADGLLLVNQEQFQGGDPYAAGMAVYSLEDRFDPRPTGFFRSTGKGVHRIVWTGGRYAYVSATPDGFDDRIWVIIDMSDPEHPVEAGRWWWPGMWRGGGERPDWPSDKPHWGAHHALVEGDRAYLGFGDAGMVILDIADPGEPTRIAGLNWSPGGATHTCMPLLGRDLVVVTDEALKERCNEEEKLVRVVDVSDEQQPRVLGICPPPPGDFCERGLRFGPHNLHENRPGSYRSEQVVFVTYFNAGLRVYDLADPTAPEEIAHWVPPVPPGQEEIQINDLFVDAAGLVYVTDRVGGGLYILQPDAALSDRMRQASA
ncbi:MAG: LVIVD repeat-containing protein [Egibacteraceae bacterium]